MKTFHNLHIEDAARMTPVPAGSIALVVTSPPYPMIEMWDPCFIGQAPELAKALRAGCGLSAFEGMHKLLDKVWREVHRVLMPGGIACINIGDATRTLDGNFTLYPNHARILSCLLSLGFNPLPEILWRKQTNAPNKFMGSGMMPPGAYVTLEHEHILVVRKGEKREFPRAADKQNRRESAYFWEERNTWFSDVWMDIKGARQGLEENGARLRSAAFPFEIPYRLVNMFSVKGDTVLDPFMGTGTTMAAAMASGRNSVGFEREVEFLGIVRSRLDTIVPFATGRIRERLAAHEAFVKSRRENNGGFKHRNRPYGFPVITKQETALLIDSPREIKAVSEASFEMSYAPGPQSEFCRDPAEEFIPQVPARPVGRPPKSGQPKKPVQQRLL